MVNQPSSTASHGCRANIVLDDNARSLFGNQISLVGGYHASCGLRPLEKE